MHTLDWIIIFGYIATTIAIGIFAARRASSSINSFFLAGRSLPWWIAGTSLAATTFSSDTPLFIAGLIHSEGIQGNWFWWSSALGSMATVFFFAKLWRRLEITTDIEFITLRYAEGNARKALRLFRVFYDGIFANCIIMASVTLAATKLVQIVFNLSHETIFTIPFLGDITQINITVISLCFIAIIYTLLSGLYGVVYTDVLQFLLAITGSFALAVIVYHSTIQNGSIIEQIESTPNIKPNTINLFPTSYASGLALFNFIIYFTCSWWKTAPGHGYTIQRLLATKSEKDSMLAFLWFCVCHYIIRPWPWIIVGLLSLIYFPNLSDPETAYPLMINRFLPIGLKGLMVTSLLAAFMSTIDTRLNWGASYIVNDLYKPYIKPSRSDRHYVTAARISMILLTMLLILATTRFSSILSAYKYLSVITGGIGTVMIARWFWWRVNVYSEISAIVSALIIGNAVSILLPDQTFNQGITANYYGFRFLINLCGSTLVWITVTLLTQNNFASTKQATKFFLKSGVTGIGWRQIANTSGHNTNQPSQIYNLIGWLIGCIFIFGLLLGIGEALLQQTIPAITLISIGIFAGLGLSIIWKKIRPHTSF